ncbi:MAG: NAD(P)-dependent glycerol-3-phosphate dehydrogenase, partial [Candidatus Daviesbacteria bacterium]|nr:NAD(P)-dependent glycerol-3-phosphate dehydrogenase [Candidatus Daviesbacteria bacterium]
MAERKRISVGPAGAWGSAFAKVAAERGHRVTIYLRDPQEVKEFQVTHRTKRLPQTVMPRHVKATSDLEEFADDADLIALAIPTQECRPFFHKLNPSISSTTYVANLSKGLERGTHLRMSEIMLEEDPTLIDRLAVISGPGVAADVAQGAIASMVVASYDPPLAEEIRSWLASNRLVVYASKDPAGVEYGGALKNVMALGAGIADEMKASATSKSFYVTRALEEMIKLGTALGGKEITFIGVSGLGDLQLSCFGDSTRNFRAGQRLVRGLSVEEIQEIELAEGLHTLKSAAELARSHNIDTSII